MFTYLLNLCMELKSGKIQALFFSKISYIKEDLIDHVLSLCGSQGAQN